VADGRYTVTLTATNAADSDVKVVPDCIIVATPPPPPAALAAAFSVTDPAAGFAPILVPFTDQSTGSITSWHWTFGDGQVSDEQSPTHAYTYIGTRTYTVTLTVTDGTDTDSVSHTVTVKARRKWFRFPHR
jgi:PKD repeat protein